MIASTACGLPTTTRLAEFKAEAATQGSGCGCGMGDGHFSLEITAGSKWSRREQTASYTFYCLEDISLFPGQAELNIYW